MRVHLGGHLSWYGSDKRAWLELDVGSVLAAPGLHGTLARMPSAGQAGRTGVQNGPSVWLTPRDVARYLGLPPGEIALIAVNGCVVDSDAARLAPDDLVEFYPPIGGG